MFYNTGGPAVIITDDCDEERRSLKNSFPFAVLLLCFFHVLQACWRFVWCAKNGIEKKGQHRYITYVQRMMYSKDNEEYVQHYQLAMKEKKYN